MPEAASFNNLDEYYATTLHELFQWSGNKSRLDRTFEKIKRGVMRPMQLKS